MSWRGPTCAARRVVDRPSGPASYGEARGDGPPASRGGRAAGEAVAWSRCDAQVTISCRRRRSIPPSPVAVWRDVSPVKSGDTAGADVEGGGRIICPPETSGARVFIPLPGTLRLRFPWMREVCLDNRAVVVRVRSSRAWAGGIRPMENSRRSPDARYVRPKAGRSMSGVDTAENARPQGRSTRGLSGRDARGTRGTRGNQAGQGADVRVGIADE